MEAGDAHWFRPSPASNSGPAARAFHAAAALGTTLFAHGGHVYVKEKKGLHKFDDLWALETVGGRGLGRIAPPFSRRMLCEAQAGPAPGPRLVSAGDGGWRLHSIPPTLK